MSLVWIQTTWIWCCLQLHPGFMASNAISFALALCLALCHCFLGFLTLIFFILGANLAYGCQKSLGLARRQDKSLVLTAKTQTKTNQNKTFHMHLIISLYVCEAFRGWNMLKASALQAPHPFVSLAVLCFDSPLSFSFQAERREKHNQPALKNILIYKEVSYVKQVSYTWLYASCWLLLMSFFPFFFFLPCGHLIKLPSHYQEWYLGFFTL